MAMQSICARLRRLLGDFRRGRDGNIAVMLALSSLPVIGLMGAAVDFSRANAVKADLQSALDAAALFVSKNAATMTEDQLKKSANDHFLTLFKNSEASQPVVSATYSTGTSTLTMAATTTMRSDFMSFLGPKFASIRIDGTSSVSWGSSRLRVALALDNTGSMALNNKMPALKTAAKNLLKQLESAATKNGDVYVSIVPFAKVVNVGKANKNASWLNLLGVVQAVIDAGKKNPDGTINLTGVDLSKYNINFSSLNFGLNLGSLNLAAVNLTTITESIKTVWNGCVTDRDQSYDTTNTSPEINKKFTLFPAELNTDTACPAEVMPLSYDWTALKNKIDAMQPNGNTNVTIGLEWAWHSLTQGAPLFPPSEESKVKYNKVIILLTDGENTENRFTNVQADIDARTKLACQNAKKDGITIYTVLVMQGTQSLLQECASDTKKFFYLQSADGLVTAFNQIGVDLTNLHVSK